MHKLWEANMIFDLDLLTLLAIGIIFSSRTTYQVWSFFDKAFLSYQLHKVKGDRHTDRHVQSYMLIFFRMGRGLTYETRHPYGAQFYYLLPKSYISSFLFL